MNDYPFKSSLIISWFTFIIPVIQSRNWKTLQVLGKQSQQDSFSACSGKVQSMGQSQTIKVTNPTLVNNHLVCRNQVRFPDNLGTKTLAIMLVVGCIIAIVLTSLMFWDDLSTFPTHMHWVYVDILETSKSWVKGEWMHQLVSPGLVSTLIDVLCPYRTISVLQS